MLKHDLSTDLTVKKLWELATGRGKIKADERLDERLQKSRNLVDDAVEKEQPLYGVTTGFGPLVDRTVSRDQAVELQYNLLQQLGCNVGPAMPAEIARATLVTRLQAISRGYSAVRPVVASRLIEMINSGVTPYLQEYGSVGASGDLVPLSRIARVLTGQDDIRLPDGSVKANSPELLRENGLQALDLEPRDGLALVNGTSFSAAITGIYLKIAEELFREVAMPLSATQYLIFDDSIQHLSDEIYKVKDHPSAREVASKFRKWLDDEQPNGSHGVPQPPYSSRSLVLWYGIVREHLDQAQKLMAKELNAVDDNPLFDGEKGEVYHAANFQGTYVAQAADEITQAMVKMANAAERQLNRLLHEKLNDDLPAFLAPQPVGVQSGLQGLQLLATSLLADIRSKAISHSSQTFPTNADNQDIVSMSANAALNARFVTEKVTYLLAAYRMAVARALQLRSAINLPKPLQEWWNVEQNARLRALDFKTVNYSRELEQIFQHHVPWKARQA